ncbi:hypothetical protein HOV49_gp24 [Staphylococcus phage vB_SpsS_QT1]|uniref:Uncharacterized protein n=1 Tax=Staphylococcus phage vB_SpsS_QT1 TaxID=2510452 RepID=A0A4P6R4G4_9CAUD|nr:hypothetical protein HOV49_gp24 [Staphylococcus phage vB_SpsS_QT1]QBJ05135.1 hypothetical protein [Staphylococcus phage vB_SpsS_QT1]
MMTAIVDATVKTIFAILSKVSSILFSSLQLSIYIISRLIVINNPFPHLFLILRIKKYHTG